MSSPPRARGDHCGRSRPRRLVAEDVLDHERADGHGGRQGGGTDDLPGRQHPQRPLHRGPFVGARGDRAHGVGPFASRGLRDEPGVAVEHGEDAGLARRRHAEDAAGEAGLAVRLDHRRVGRAAEHAELDRRRVPAAASAACCSTGSLSRMSRRPWIGIQPSQYSTTCRNVTGPPAPPMTTGGCGCWTGLGQLQPARSGRTRRRTRPRPRVHSSLHREHLLAGHGAAPARIDAVVLHLVLVPADADAERPRGPPRRGRARRPSSPGRSGRAGRRGRSRCRAAAARVTAAAAVSATNGSSVRRYSSGRSGPPGHGVRRLAGMWVCSVTHSDSKPRSSSRVARRSGRIDRSVGKIRMPSSTTAVWPLAARRPGHTLRCRDVADATTCRSVCRRHVSGTDASWPRSGPDGPGRVAAERVAALAPDPSTTRLANG